MAPPPSSSSSSSSSSFSSSSAPVLDLPVGYIFQPTDEELLGYYLYNKICGTPFKYDFVIPVTELYRNCIEPEDIWNDLDGPKLRKNQDLYFFTTLKKVSDKGSRVARKAGSGSWKGENSGTKVYYYDANKKKHILGLWKRFHYENNQSDKQNDSWILHEYSLKESLMPKSSNSSTGGDDQEQYVLCRLRRKIVDRKRKVVVAAAAENVAQNKIPRLAMENYISESQSLIMSKVIDHNTEPQISGFISDHLCQPPADPPVGLMSTTQQLESDYSLEINDIDDDAFLIDFSSIWDSDCMNIDQSTEHNNTALAQVVPVDDNSYPYPYMQHYSTVNAEMTKTYDYDHDRDGESHTITQQQQQHAANYYSAFNEQIHF